MIKPTQLKAKRNSSLPYIKIWFEFTKLLIVVMGGKSNEATCLKSIWVLILDWAHNLLRVWLTAVQDYPTNHQILNPILNCSCLLRRCLTGNHTSVQRMPATPAMAKRACTSSACTYHRRLSGSRPSSKGSNPKSPASLQITCAYHYIEDLSRCHFLNP